MRMAPAPGRRTLVAAAALAAAAIAVPLGFGSSHREAPNIMLDPSADNTDVYAYTAADATDALTIVSNWIPGQVPANGPNFFRFDDRARYYINVDSNGNGLPDVDYQFRFNTEVANPNSFLNAGPGVQDYGDLNLSQTYDVVRREYNGAGTRVTGSEKVGDDLNVAPSNIGPKTYPNYDNFVNGAKQTLADGTKLFVGQREDPFYVDLGAAFDAINIRYDGTTGNQGGGKDDFSGYNTSSIVMQLPEELVTRDGQSVANADAKNAVVGVWSTTERRALEVTGADYDERGGSGGWVQVSRLGNPLINEVIIPLGEKDRFNRTEPADDAANYGEYVLKPELAAVMNALFNIGAPEENRTDLLPLLTGIQGLNQQQGPVRRYPGRHPQGQSRHPAGGDRGPLRGDRRRCRRVPERAAPGRRCRRHAPPGGRRVPGLASRTRCRSETASMRTTCHSTTRSRTSATRSRGSTPEPQPGSSPRTRPSRQAAQQRRRSVGSPPRTRRRPGPRPSQGAFR